MKTLGTKVNDESYYLFVDRCKQRGITASAKLRDLIINESQFSEPFDLNKVFEHLKTCRKCMHSLIDKGYVLVSLKELKKYNLEIYENPM